MIGYTGGEIILNQAGLEPLPAAAQRKDRLRRLADLAATTR